MFVFWSRLGTALGCALGLAALARAQDAPPRTFTLDAVELVRTGKEVSGDPAQHTRRGAYTYHFASAANRTAFEESPEKYEIQLGGACARMGPLSGEGRCDIYAVHAGKLYIFASPQCREGFLKSPEKLLETDDPPVTAEPAAQTRGRALLDQAVKAHGGAAAIDAVRTYRQCVESRTEYQGTWLRTDRLVLIAFPDRAREESYWGERMWAHAAGDRDGAFFTDQGYDRLMAAAQVRAVRRQLNRHLLTILRSRTRPDFVAACTGTGSVNGTSVDQVAVSFDGTTCTLGIDARGRVLSLAYRGRGGRSTLGTIEKTFLDWQTVDGLVLPTRWTATFDGEAPAGEPTQLSRVEVNPPLAPELFRAPIER
jgi:YHS domain-containing protein